jgi:SAM-dependent methyltransferase
MAVNIWELADADLHRLFEMKYGHPDTAGWSPRRRLKYGYYHPSDIYEAVVEKLVGSSTKWIDVGGGRALFPDNTRLSAILAKRCERLVAVDPSENVFENPYAHLRVNCKIEDFETDVKFDLATFRMVAEHISNPEAVLFRLSKILTESGIVVIYTINKVSPIPIITRFIPFSYHYRVKRLFWKGEEKDTFPVAYKMNTRKTLKVLFSKYGFIEQAFMYLDDLSTFSGFKTLNLLELWAWKLFRQLRIKYPENNLLGIYRRS